MKREYDKFDNASQESQKADKKFENVASEIQKADKKFDNVVSESQKTTKMLRNILTILLCGGILFGLSIFSWIKAPHAYSNSERRSLAQLPKLSGETLKSGRFMKEFEDYSTDQFPMRDEFRSFKAYVGKNIFQEKDNHGIYTVDGYLSKLEYPLNPDKVKRNCQQMRKVYETYLADSHCKTYLSIIPDKNYFLAPLGGYPSMDYDQMVDMVLENVPPNQYIHIFDLLSLEDYYRTDQHWRQECVIDVAERLGEVMEQPKKDLGQYVQTMGDNSADSEYKNIAGKSGENVDEDIDGNSGKKWDMTYIDNTSEYPLYGAYVGQSALPFPGDTIHFLTNDILNQCTVTSYRAGEAQEEASMYDMSKADSRDPYELFLGGADPLIIIDNPQAANEKELILFRDSFGSSLAPLLVPYYKKITLVDLRYMQSGLLGNYITFDEQDVLFLYSTLILNH